MESRIESKDIAMTLATVHIAMRGVVPIRIGLPDFVARCARASTGTLVVKRNGKDGEEWQRKDCECKPKTAATIRWYGSWGKRGSAHAHLLQFLMMYSPTR